VLLANGRFFQAGLCLAESADYNSSPGGIPAQFSPALHAEPRHQAGSLCRAPAQHPTAWIATWSTTRI
jgi:hypothetical protein